MRSFKKVFTVLSMLVIFCFLQNCREEISCFTPPEPVYFKFVDATSGENLITNGILNPKNFSLKDQNNNTETFRLITENNLNAVIVNVGWNEGTKNYTFDLGQNKIFKFDVTSKKLTGDCGGFKVEKIEIKDHAFGMEDYFYLIKL